MEEKEIKELYSDTGIYSDIRYANPGVSRGLVHAHYYTQTIYKRIEDKPRKILVIGGGPGYEAVYFIKQGLNVKMVELFMPDVPILKDKTVVTFAQDMPFEDKEFDLVFCCETMEHIPEEQTNAVLQEVRRVSDKVYFTIATRDDPPFHTHIMIADAMWWMNHFLEQGFTIINAQMNPMLCFVQHGEMTAGQYSEGVVIYAGC